VLCSSVCRILEATTTLFSNLDPRHIQLSNQLNVPAAPGLKGFNWKPMNRRGHFMGSEDHSRPVYAAQRMNPIVVEYQKGAP